MLVKYKINIHCLFFSLSSQKEPTGSAVAVPHTSSQLLFGECIANGCFIMYIAAQVLIT